MQIKEVLKQTAERRGPASAPTVDPYWNRDFGYGMVDARAAVELSMHLLETNQTTSIDWTIQNHLLNVTQEAVPQLSLAMLGHNPMSLSASNIE